MMADDWMDRIIVGAKERDHKQELEIARAELSRARFKAQADEFWAKVKAVLTETIAAFNVKVNDHNKIEVLVVPGDQFRAQKQGAMGGSVVVGLNREQQFLSCAYEAHGQGARAIPPTRHFALNASEGGIQSLRAARWYKLQNLAA
jgi:hypothetical protein